MHAVISGPYVYTGDNPVNKTDTAGDLTLTASQTFFLRDSYGDSAAANVELTSPVLYTARAVLNLVDLSFTNIAAAYVWNLWVINGWLFWAWTKSTGPTRVNGNGRVFSQRTALTPSPKGSWLRGGVLDVVAVWANGGEAVVPLIQTDLIRPFG